jgi:putative transposase
MFEQDISVVQVATILRVSTNSVYQWRRRWHSGGTAALASTGPDGNPCRLSPAQQARLASELGRGLAARRWSEDQRWTLARISRLMGRLFHVS